MVAIFILTFLLTVLRNVSHEQFSNDFQTENVTSIDQYPSPSLQQTNTMGENSVTKSVQPPEKHLMVETFRNDATGTEELHKTMKDGSILSSHRSGAEMQNASFYRRSAVSTIKGRIPNTTRIPNIDGEVWVSGYSTTDLLKPSSTYTPFRPLTHFRPRGVADKNQGNISSITVKTASQITSENKSFQNLSALPSLRNEADPEAYLAPVIQAYGIFSFNEDTTNEYTRNETLDTDMMQAVVYRIDRCTRDSEGGDMCSNQYFCSCDKDCLIFDNCCYDSKPQTSEFELLKLNLIYEHFSCEFSSPDSRNGYLMITSCPPTWKGDYMKWICENPNSTDAVGLVPVTDILTGITYRNVYCATCHGKTETRYWNSYMKKCPTFFKIWNTDDKILDKLNNLVQERLCRIEYSPIPSTKLTRCFRKYFNEYQCYDQDPREFFLSRSRSRDKEFPGDIINSVDNLTPGHIFALFNDTERLQRFLQHVCKVYHNIRANAEIIYRNIICSWCVKSSLKCAKKAFDMKSLPTFSVLINFTAVMSKEGSRIARCGHSEVYDKLQKKCRHLFCPGDEFPSYGVCTRYYLSIANLILRLTLYVMCLEPDVTPRVEMFVVFLERKYSLSIAHSVESNTPLNRTIDEQGATLLICSALCINLKIENRISVDMINDLKRTFSKPFIKRPGLSAMYTQLAESHDTLCENATLSGSLNPMNCPYVKLNNTELDFMKEERSPEVFDNIHTTPSANIHLICLNEYEKIRARPSSQDWGGSKSWERIISYVLLIMSLIGLLISLYTYIAHPKLKSVPCRLSLNIIVVLFLTNSILVTRPLYYNNEIVCYCVAVVSHYLWLCTFALMFAYSCHILYTFCGNAFRTSNSPQGHRRMSVRLVLYLALCYLLPLTITVTSLVLDHTRILAIHYGAPTCFINNPPALLMVFGGPVSLIILHNCIVISVTSFTICVRSSSAVQSQTKKTKLLLFAILKMTVFLGLVWVFGILAAFTNLRVMWIVYDIVSSSHGLLVFLTHVLGSGGAVKWYKIKFLEMKARFSN